MIGSGLRKLLHALAAAALAGQPALAPAAAQPAQPQAAAPAPREARPALWRVRDEDTTIYLFGTMHALPPGLEWRSERLRQAMAGADELVLEVAGDDPLALAQAVRGGISTQLPPILERVPAERREALRAAIAASGVPIQAFDRMKSWTAGLFLAVMSLQRMGVESTLGVEEGLRAGWDDSGRQVIGLETAAEQFGFFDQLSEESQRLFLIAVTEDEAETRRQFQEMVDAWSAGDVEGIARTFNADASLSDELRDVLLTRRNATWADWLRQRMERPGTVFVAVGAGHLAGDGSVQTMLAERGLRAERVQ